MTPLLLYVSLVRVTTLLPLLSSLHLSILGVGTLDLTNCPMVLPALLV